MSFLSAREFCCVHQFFWLVQLGAQLQSSDDFDFVALSHFCDLALFKTDVAFVARGWHSNR